MQRTSTNEVEEQTLHLLEEMLANVPDVLGVRLWNGQLWPGERPRAATLVLQHSNTLTEMLSSGTEAGLAECYLHKDFDLEGDIEAAFECVGGTGFRVLARQQPCHNGRSGNFRPQ